MREALVASWGEMGEKVVRLADAVPEQAYDVRPAAGVRSFAEQLRHLAFWNQYARDALRGAAPDGDANELPGTAYPDKAAVVAVVRESFAEVWAAAARGGRLQAAASRPRLDSLAPAGEHYGQLVVYARLAGVVPPASRPSTDPSAEPPAAPAAQAGEG